MKKEKSLDTAVFRKQYEHLNDAPIEVWIAEFLRRNPEFRKDCSEAWKYPAYELMRGEMLKKYGVLVRSWHLEHPGALPVVEVELEPPVRGIRIERWSKENPRFVKILDRLGEADPSEASCLIGIADKNASARDVLDYLLNYRIPTSESLVNGEGLCDESLPEADDVLLLAIDLRSNREQIDEWLKRFLRLHHTREKPHFLPEKWIQYLMIYDLREFHGKPDNDIADNMTELFPELKQRSGDPFFSEPQNVGEYYKNARNLINFEYRKFARHFRLK